MHFWQKLPNCGAIRHNSIAWLGVIKNFVDCYTDIQIRCTPPCDFGDAQVHTAYCLFLTVREADGGRLNLWYRKRIPWCAESGGFVVLNKLWTKRYFETICIFAVISLRYWTPPCKQELARVLTFKMAHTHLLDLNLGYTMSCHWSWDCGKRSQTNSHLQVTSSYFTWGVFIAVVR